MDSLNQTVQTNSRQLIYRIRSSARYHYLPDGKPVLLLQFPLRVAFIPHYWHPVLACLKNDAWMALERISAEAPQIPITQIELFLNSLIRKGYIDQEGFPLLAETDYPMVSVIIPVRNRPDDIAECLQSLIGLDYPAQKLEIIVVDDASADTTPEVVTRFPKVRLLQMSQRRQASFCRNRAAEIAGGEILAFIDSDCLAARTWLRELVPAFRDNTLGALGGRVDGAFEDNKLDQYEKVKSALKMGSWFKRSGQAERFFYVPACNFLVKKDVFKRLNGFRETLHVGEDVDFCWRLQDAAYSLEYRPMGRVSHKHRNRLNAFCARRFDYGTSEPVLQQMHTSRVKTLFLPWNESLFWLAVILSLILKSPVALAAGCGLLMVGSSTKYGKLRARRIPITRFQVFKAVIRSHLSFVYHCCNFISRYYLVVIPVVLLFSLLTAAIMMGMHLTAGIVDYAIKKPQLNPISFLFFFTLEQASYQSGVWWECIRQINFNPVLPRIVHKRV
jgi:mycofactocin system glycosyltransferase